MKLRSVYFIGLLTTIFVGCSEPQTQEDAVTPDESTVDSIEQEAFVDTLSIQTDSIAQEIAQFVFGGLPELRELIKNEYRTGKYLKDQPLNSFVIKGRDSIRKITYITDIFQLDEIDSIEFFGAIDKGKVNPYYLNLNSLLVLYFNDERLSRSQRDSLEINCTNHFRAIEDMFKAGGTSFEIDGQLALYSVNTCGPGYKNLQRIDTLIKNGVFGGKSFVRLHAGCGMGPFRKLEN